MKFSFGGNTGQTYEQLQHKRRVAEALMKQQSAPRNISEGITSAANSIAGAIMARKADKGLAKGQADADALWGEATGSQRVANALMGNFPASLIQSESGGNWGALNDVEGAGGIVGHGGRLQFGGARLQDAARAGIIPEMSPQQFAQQPPEVQQRVENWHFGDIDAETDRMGLSRYIGQEVAGIPITRDAIRSMAHLGGIGGAKSFLESGGRHNPADANGTSLADYARMHGGGQQGSGGANGNLQRIAKALSNPYIQNDPGKSAVLQAMLKREMQSSDPMRQLQMQNLQSQIDARSAPTREREKDASGRWRYVDDGSFVFPEAQSAVRPITAQERADWGIPEADQRPYSMTPKGPALIGGGGVTVNNNMGNDKFNEAFAKGDAKALGVISEAGMSAQRNLPRIGQLEELLKETPTGLIGLAQQMAGEWGIPTEGLSNIQAAQALVNTMVPEQRQPGSGPMSDADLALFKESLPRIINRPEGNAMIVQTLKGIAEYDAQGAGIVQQLRAGEISRADAFAALQSRENPLEGFKVPKREESSPARISGDDEYEALPSGAVFIGPDGVTRRKP
jgi:hypothetical protein